jgi:hypothetical protein
MLLRRSLHGCVSPCLMARFASVTRQDPLTCQAPSNEAPGNKSAMEDALNEVACNLDNSTVAFTSLVTDLTGVASCTTHHASCGPAFVGLATTAL